VFLVQRNNGSKFFTSMDREQQIAIGPVTRRSASLALLGPKTRRRAPCGGCDGDVAKLTRQLVESPKTVTRIDSQQLSPQLEIRELRPEKLVLGDRTPKPRAHVIVLAEGGRSVRALPYRGAASLGGLVGKRPPELRSVIG